MNVKTMVKGNQDSSEKKILQTYQTLLEAKR